LKRSHIVALVLIAACFAIIMVMLNDSSSYETFASAEKKEGIELHVVGTLVKEGAQEYDPAKDPNYFSFWMKDQDGDDRQVIFSGAKPQDFERSEQIVLTGKMDDGVFMAKKILMKCPSKYIQEEMPEGVEVMESTASNQ
jgi:cytochrome c-type biogenesis protein CcmE